MRMLWEGFEKHVTLIGEAGVFVCRALACIFQKPYRYVPLLLQAEFVGVGSLFIIGLTGMFSGAVFTLQSVNALERVGMESLVGSMVMLAVTRELAPVLTSLMLAGRAGSAMATELGTMRVTEQIDAMEVMAVNPIQYLVAPRVWGCLLMAPVLTVLFNLVALLGSYSVAIGVLGIDEGAYWARMQWYVDPTDVVHGMIKSVVFGVWVASVGCYKGYHASGGARGVGVATTQAVVVGSVGIFIADYVLTQLLLRYMHTQQW
jgi:phospholipid/cholesterol/gamma-HCH transport system permease protein